MRRYRVLIYDGEADWLAPNKHEFVKPNQPYRCGRGTIHSMELISATKLAKNDLFLSSMELLELLADEVVEHEKKEPDADTE